MHEYLDKYFENSKKTKKILIRNMKPLSIRKAPSDREVRGVFPPALIVVDERSGIVRHWYP